MDLKRAQANIALTKALMQRVGKTPVIVKKDIYGLLGTRIQLAMIREIESLIAQDVASLEDINLVAQASYGMRHACIGHIEALDMFGLDTMVVIEGRIFPELSNAERTIGDSQGEGGKGRPWV